VTYQRPRAVTVSGGSRVFRGCGSAVDLFAAADQNLYRAKDMGRNQIVAAPPVRGEMAKPAVT
jgi:PleD family two-component response regulator